MCYREKGADPFAFGVDPDAYETREKYHFEGADAVYMDNDSVFNYVLLLDFAVFAYH